MFDQTHANAAAVTEPEMTAVSKLAGKLQQNYQTVGVSGTSVSTKRRRSKIIMSTMNTESARPDSVATQECIV